MLRSLTLVAHDSDLSDTALGDWYVNRIVVDRQPLLMLVSSKSLLSILAPARDVKTLPQHLAAIVADRLRRLEVSDSVIASEVNAMGTARVGKTLDRSVTGTMVDFAKAIPYYLPVRGWDAANLRDVEERLAETPCRSSRPFEEVIFPLQTAIRLLQSTWPGSATRH